MLLRARGSLDGRQRYYRQMCFDEHDCFSKSKYEAVLELIDVVDSITRCLS